MCLCVWRAVTETLHHINYFGCFDDGGVCINNVVMCLLKLLLLQLVYIRCCVCVWRGGCVYNSRFFFLERVKRRTVATYTRRAAKFAWCVCV